MKTLDAPEYDPLDGSYAQQEETMAAWVTRLVQTGDGLPVHQVQSVSTSLYHAMTLPSSLLLQEVSPVLCECTFATNMQDAVQVSSILSLKTLPQDHLDPQTLANNWGIGIETAK